MPETDEYLLHRCSHSRPFPAIPCAATVSSRPLLLHLEAQAVCDHGDELAIGGLALGGVDGVAEVLLQRLQVAAVPGHLDGVADIAGRSRPAIGSASATFSNPCSIGLSVALNSSPLLGRLYCIKNAWLLSNLETYEYSLFIINVYGFGVKYTNFCHK